MITQSYLVNGMTCAHCVASVTEEIAEIPGVESVRVELVKGGASTVHVDSADALDLELVRAAVDEAGYALSDPS